MVNDTSSRIIRFVNSQWFDANGRAVAAFKRVCRQNCIPYTKRKCLFHSLGDTEYTWYFLRNEDYIVLRLLLPQNVQSKLIEFDQEERKLKR